MRGELYDRLQERQRTRPRLSGRQAEDHIRRGAEPAHRCIWIGSTSSGKANATIRTARLAAHVLGSVDFEEKGNAGIEKALEADLRGIPGHMRLLTDVKRRGIDSQLESGAGPARPFTLTIDERLQFVAERELAAAVRTHHARNRQRGGDEPAYRRHPGDGQLSHLRSKRSAEARRQPP